MVRSKGLEPSRLLGTTTSRLRVYQFHHERIAGRGTWLKHRPLDKPFLPSRWHLVVFCRLAALGFAGCANLWRTRHLNRSR